VVCQGSEESLWVPVDCRIQKMRRRTIAEREEELKRNDDDEEYDSDEEGMLTTR
jgi:hypothetical protein